jgi:hypothetical protein
MAQAWQGFAYGEHLDELAQRSLGYRLLAPLPPQAWSEEVEALARRLQTAPYPEHWPASELFCSLLLATGQRLVAVARYGLVDHTPSQRRGGLELIGAVGPVNVTIAQALALYHHFRQRRQETDDLHRLGDCPNVEEILIKQPAQPLPAEPVPVLPIRLWQDGALLFAATGPADPDHNLRLLEEGAGDSWQWLPFIGVDFPLQTIAQRGPAIAWTPHLSGVALKLDRKPVERALSGGPPRLQPAGVLKVLAGVLLVALLFANLLELLALKRLVGAALATPAPAAPVSESSDQQLNKAAQEAREQLAEGLYDLILDQGGKTELAQNEEQHLAQYERLARSHPALRLMDASAKGKTAIGALTALTGRTADRIEESIRKALVDRGYSDKLIQAACEQVRKQLAAESGTHLLPRCKRPPFTTGMRPALRIGGLPRDHWFTNPYNSGQSPKVSRVRVFTS